MYGRKSTWGALLALAFCSCKSPTQSASNLAPLDTKLFAGVFNPNTLVDNASFTDAVTISAATVQSFLEATPYGGASFLATYTSHGMTAASAFVLAATAEGINPLALLARAEADQGLVSQAVYPSDPSRVEYAWQCGCSGPGVCDPAWAGFDRQVLCVAAQLATSVEAVGRDGATAGGWGPGLAQQTLDGDAVTPTNAATAALYQFDPVEGEASNTGGWLFWNVWQRYAVALNYYGP